MYSSALLFSVGTSSIVDRQPLGSKNQVYLLLYRHPSALQMDAYNINIKTESQKLQRRKLGSSTSVDCLVCQTYDSTRRHFQDEFVGEVQCAS